MYVDFYEYPTYSGKTYEIKKKMLMKIFSVFIVMHILKKKQKICTWVNKESWGMMRTCFPDAKQIIKCTKLFYAKNVHMFKNI